MNHNLRGFVAIFCLAIVCSTGCMFASAAIEGTFTKTLSVTGPVDLDVATGSGSIQVRTGEPTGVEIHAVIRARDDSRARAEEKIRYLQSNPPIEQEGNTIRIGRIADRNYRNNVSISYEIVVPTETRLRSKTGSGSQSIEDIQGPLDASTGSGRITATNIGDEVGVSTGSGSITLDSINGRANAKTGSGSIRALGVGGPFTGRTGSGGIRLEQTAPGDVEVSTGSGGIEASGVQGAVSAKTGSGRITISGDPTGEWDIQGSSGGIQILLNSRAAFDLDAYASSGDITVDHPVTVTGSISRREVRGKVRGGGHLLRIRSGSGDVVIR